PVYEDAIRALRAAFGRREPRYDGPFHRLGDVVVDPCGLQEHDPIWRRARAPRSLRRALALADGWDPFGLDLEQLETLVAKARDWREGGGRAAAVGRVRPTR